MTTAAGVGVAIGLILGGVIVDRFDWHWLFAASAVLLPLSWIAVRLWVPSRPGFPPREPIDWIEGLMPVPGIVALLLRISPSKRNGWLDEQVWGLITLGILVLALWARRSLRAREPFINLRLLGHRNIALANLIGVLLALGTMQIIFVFSTYTQAPAWTMAGLGLSATIAGLANRAMASAIGSQVIAVLLSSHVVRSPDGGASFPSAIGYSVAIGWIAAVTLAATAIALLIRVPRS